MVHAIIREFERNPPVLVSEASSNVSCTAGENFYDFLKFIPYGNSLQIQGNL